MATELFSNGTHRCIIFNDLVRGDNGVQANQFLVMHGEYSALIDPGGALLYTPLSIAIAAYVRPKNLTYIFASHQDPDIIGSVDCWLMYTPAIIVCSQLWGRFIPHSVPHYQKGAGVDRYRLLPDEGGDVSFGSSVIRAVPAHFLHSVGNFQFYDPVSKILFSGDVGASMVDDSDFSPVSDFDSHVKTMDGFHRRYMTSNRACRLWAERVRKLDINLIVPQHGRPMIGAAIPRFMDWMSSLRCGVDLLDDPAGIFG